jgi:D-threo-aldose 1-dehydrogenase
LVGSTKVEITRLGLGGAALGNLYQGIDEDQASATIQAALGAGLRYLDTAPLYGVGLSEQRLGKALASVPRHRFVISTKVGYDLRPADGQMAGVAGYVHTPPFIPVHDYSRDAIRRSLAGSLRRLSLEAIDIVYIHDPDEGSTMSGLHPYAHSHFKQVMDETYPLLASLRDQGVIQALGVGINQWQMLIDFANAGDFDCFLLAGRYTLLEQDAGLTLLPLCLERGISVIIGGAYNSGILATGATEQAMYNYQPAPAAIRERVAAISDICDQHNVPLAAAALQFPMAHPAVISVIPGARSVAEFEQNLAYLQMDIPRALWRQLQEAGLILPGLPLPE